VGQSSANKYKTCLILTVRTVSDATLSDVVVGQGKTGKSSENVEQAERVVATRQVFRRVQGDDLVHVREHRPNIKYDFFS